MERRQLEDFPDEWYELINKEIDALLQPLLKYPVEFISIVLQSAFQIFIYSNFEKGERSELLKNVMEAFLLTFEQWDSEQSDEGRSAQ
jgi:hypothetical protein